MSGSRELAARAVACKHWRWLPGMHDTQGCVVFKSGGEPWVLDNGTLVETSRGPEVEAAKIDGDMRPDLDDSATLGCLLALVREAWGDPTIHVLCERLCHEPDPGSWTVWRDRGEYPLFASDGDQDPDRAFDTETEALVAALEAAP